ncbi:hypothetical protein H4R99_006602 [Coemansia sp. RSA 1722]|nr:hypothetical protein H4R99_006602 [Coemansia sp. RSA 1722]
MANIWIAASDGNLARVQELVEKDKAIVNAKDQNGYSPMHAASSWSHLHVLKYLIENGGDVNITDPDGDTPLHICEDKECAALLLEHGADPSIENHEGLSPVHTTLENEATEVTEMLCERLGIPVPKLEEIRNEDDDDNNGDANGNSDALNDAITDAKLEELSNWLLQNAEENSEADEDALREMVTNFVLQRLRISNGENKPDDTVAATIASSTDRRSLDDPAFAHEQSDSKSEESKEADQETR